MAGADAIRKFDFNNSFDTNEKGVAASRDFTADDVANARAEGFAEGKQAGAAEERARIESTATLTLQQLEQQLAAMAGEIETLKTAVETKALETVLTIARKLVPHYAKAHGLDEIEGVIHDCMTAVYDEPRIVVRVNDTILDHVKGQLEKLAGQSGFSGKTVLFADPSLAPEDCRVEWADGGAERDSERLWQEIDETISRFLGREPSTDGGESAAGGNDSQ